MYVCGRLGLVPNNRVCVELGVELINHVCVDGLVLCLTTVCNPDQFSVCVGLTSVRGGVGNF